LTDAEQRLTADLERAALRAILRTYADLNATFFSQKLRRPQIELTDSTTRLGAWMRPHRRLQISRKLLIVHGWGAVVEVLKHEMAHQYVDEVLGFDGESAHGPSFRRVCEERGFDARAFGVPSPGDGAAPPVLDRIAKLLALAGSPNEHEAQAAMSAAQRLMLKYNIDEASRPDRVTSFRHLGNPSGRISEAERVLATILSEHFFVDAIWVPVWRPLEGRRGSILEICGRLENLDMAEYVYAFLSQTAARLWKEHKRALGIRGNQARRAYIAGVMSGFRSKLGDQAEQNAEEGLVWVGDAEVEHYFKQRHPRVRWTRHVSTRGSAAHRQGAEAGRRIVLHRGVSRGASGTVRLLKGRN
jgi:hypothetical protein